MNTVFFFYTIAFIAFCVLTSVVLGMSYIACRRRILLCGMAIFIAYGVETTEIFFSEFTQMGEAVSLISYYAVEFPLIKTLVAALAVYFTWRCALLFIEIDWSALSWQSLCVPVGFFVLSLLTVMLVPEGAWQQWIYYALRSVFNLGIIMFAYHHIRTAGTPHLKHVVEHSLPLLVFLVVCALAVLVEDTLVILVLPPQGTIIDLYFSERNFSENVLAVTGAVLLMRYAFGLIAVRWAKTAPEVDQSSRESAIDDTMPLFIKRFGLSDREREVLLLLLDHQSNTQIAQTLTLATGTVKSHVHNIMKKCGVTSRKELDQLFWQS